MHHLRCSILRGKDVFKDVYCGAEPYDGDSYTLDFLGSGNAVLDMFGELPCCSLATPSSSAVQPRGAEKGRPQADPIRSATPYLMPTVESCTQAVTAMGS